MSRSSKWSLPFRHSNQNFVSMSYLSVLLHSPPWFNYPNNMNIQLFPDHLKQDLNPFYYHSNVDLVKEIYTNSVTLNIITTLIVNTSSLATFIQGKFLSNAISCFIIMQLNYKHTQYVTWYGLYAVHSLLLDVETIRVALNKLQMSTQFKYNL
jgi:hypothetical protein